jgi:hypothetical protein
MNAVRSELQQVRSVSSLDAAAAPPSTQGPEPAGGDFTGRGHEQAHRPAVSRQSAAVRMETRYIGGKNRLASSLML